MQDEITLKEYIDTRMTAIEKQITDLSSFISQHFDLNAKAYTAADEMMKIRLDGMNEFREQIKAERSDYVTKDTIKWIIGFIGLPTILATISLLVVLLHGG